MDLEKKELLELEKDLLDGKKIALGKNLFDAKKIQLGTEYSKQIKGKMEAENEGKMKSTLSEIADSIDKKYEEGAKLSSNINQEAKLNTVTHNGITHFISDYDLESKTYSSATIPPVSVDNHIEKVDKNNSYKAKKRRAVKFIKNKKTKEKMSKKSKRINRAHR
jgi:hypothetical protein